MDGGSPWFYPDDPVEAAVADRDTYGEDDFSYSLEFSRHRHQGAILPNMLELRKYK